MTSMIHVIPLSILQKKIFIINKRIIDPRRDKIEKHKDNLLNLIPFVNKILTEDNFAGD